MDGNTYRYSESRSLICALESADFRPKLGLNRVTFFQSNLTSLCLPDRHHQVKEHKGTRDSRSCLNFVKFSSLLASNCFHLRLRLKENASELEEEFEEQTYADNSISWRSCTQVESVRALS